MCCKIVGGAGSRLGPTVSSRQRCRKSRKSRGREQSLSKSSRIKLSLMLNPYILILSFLDVKFDDPIVFKDCTAKGFEKTIKGKKVVAVKRWGKYFWYVTIPAGTLMARLKMDSPPHPVLHFGTVIRWGMAKNGRNDWMDPCTRSKYSLSPGEGR